MQYIEATGPFEVPDPPEPPKPTLYMAIYLLEKASQELYRGQVCNPANDLTVDDLTTLVQAMHQINQIKDLLNRQAKTIEARRKPQAQRGVSADA